MTRGQRQTAFYKHKQQMIAYRHCNYCIVRIL